MTARAISNSLLVSSRYSSDMAETKDRLADLMDEHGHDQAALAAAIGVTQGTISLILIGKTRRSRYLPEIADLYGVSVRWLRGENVPKKGGGERPLLSSPTPPDLFLKVSLPPEEALTQMFEALLSGLDRNAPLSEQARLLAKRLPIGLSQLQELRPAPIRARARVREQA
jgi:transcriptional regulator with XRE-family HTH domain